MRRLLLWLLPGRLRLLRPWLRLLPPRLRLLSDLPDQWLPLRPSRPCPRLLPLHPSVLASRSVPLRPLRRLHQSVRLLLLLHQSVPSVQWVPLRR